MTPVLMTNSANVALDIVRRFLLKKTSLRDDRERPDDSGLVEASLRMCGGPNNRTRPAMTIPAERRKLPLNSRRDIMYPLKVEPTTVPKNSMPWKRPMALPRRCASKRLTT